MARRMKNRKNVKGGIIIIAAFVIIAAFFFSTTSDEDEKMPSSFYRFAGSIAVCFVLLAFVYFTKKSWDKNTRFVLAMFCIYGIIMMYAIPAHDAFIDDLQRETEYTEVSEGEAWLDSASMYYEAPGWIWYTYTPVAQGSNTYMMISQTIEPVDDETYYFNVTNFPDCDKITIYFDVAGGGDVFTASDGIAIRTSGNNYQEEIIDLGYDYPTATLDARTITFYKTGTFDYDDITRITVIDMQGCNEMPNSAYFNMTVQFYNDTTNYDWWEPTVTDWNIIGIGICGVVLIATTVLGIAVMASTNTRGARLFLLFLAFFIFLLWCLYDGYEFYHGTDDMKFSERFWEPSQYLMDGNSTSFNYAAAALFGGWLIVVFFGAFQTLFYYVRWEQLRKRKSRRKST